VYFNSRLIDKKKRKENDEAYNTLTFNDKDVIEVWKYGLNIDNLGKKRRYIIELHKYKGFSFLKFYPKKLSRYRRKFEIRGSELGFNMTKENIIYLLFENAKIMKNYLDYNSNDFVGYIGQPDAKDNQRNKINSQRSNVYNLLANSIFPTQKYKLSSKNIFAEINLRLIRKVVSKQNGKLTRQQMENYNNFLTFFEKYKEQHSNFMTEEVKKNIQQ